MRMTGDHTPTVIREFPSTSRHIHADHQSCSLIQSLQCPYVQLHQWGIFTPVRGASSLIKILKSSIKLIGAFLTLKQAFCCCGLQH